MADHANRGVGWERVLEGWHGQYRKAEPPRAVVFRCQPPIDVLSTPRMVKRRGRERLEFTATWRSEGPPDYTGLVAASPGRVPSIPVLFDAKDCEAGLWSFGLLERHQARDLEAVHLAGGLAFVALRLEGECWLLPWVELGPLWWAWHERTARAAKGTASLDAAGCGRIGMRMPTPGDWLGALVAGGVV